MKLRLIIFLCFFAGGLARAQQKNIPLNRQFFLSTEKHLLEDSSFTHTNFKPLIESKSVSIESYHRLNTDTTFHVKKNLLSQKVHAQHLLILNDSADKFYLSIDPVFNFELGKDLSDSMGKVYKNTRGILIQGDISRHFSFESSFYENQATFVNYISDFIDSTGVAPGQGRVKQFKTSGYDFAFSSGYFSYSPGKHFNFQAGHGKNFVGEGYRSLLLSDNSFNYPYLKITSTFWKIQYTNLYASFINLFNGTFSSTPGTERLFQKKAGVFQNLSITLAKRLELSVFQGLIWQANNSRNQSDLNLYFFNPVIFVSAGKYGLGDNNNVILGSTIKLKVTNNISLYSQLMVDNLATGRLKGSIQNKNGYQAGIKIYEPFKIKQLYLQAEYNQVRPYSYAHKNPEQSFTHYNQPLAHPLGANFKEFVSFLNYRYQGFFTELKISMSKIGLDSAGYSFGNNIFASDFDAYYGPKSTINLQNQGTDGRLNYLDLKIGYVLNPVTHYNIVAGISNRSLEIAGEKKQTRYVYFSIRTSLNNFYYDF